MSNIVDRLRDRAYSTKAGDALCEDAAALIEVLQWRSKVHANVIARLSAEVERLRITDDERAAIKTAVGGMCLWMKENEVTEDESLRRRCAVLRNLLERLHT